VDAQTLTLIACAALLLLAGGGLAAARAARADHARLGAEVEARRREAEEARMAAQVARAEGQGRAGLLAARDARLAEVLDEAAAWRRSHDEARAACADAESRCARAGEAVERLEAAAARLREDHAEALRARREEAARLEERLRSAEAEFGRLSAAHAALQKERDERLASAEREVAALKELREEMTREFRDLAGRTLRETGTEFSEAHQQKLTELLTPFREQVNRFEAELREVHKSADRDRALLGQQIVMLTTKTDAVSQEATNLARALKGEKHRQGAWGEARLEEYLVHMGLQRDVHYFVQAQRRDDEGNDYRPDVILRMPDGKCIVIDSKVSLVAYTAAMNATTDEERTAHLREHVRAVRAHIDLLSAKAYERLEQGSVNWVMMFMPIEGAVSAAWAHEADIGTYAMDRNIGIAYPTTLLMALKTFDQLWKIEQRNKNADKIADRAGRLYEKLAGVIESFKRVGGALESARGAHAEAMGRLSEGNGNLATQVEQLKRLGAKTNKSLPIAVEDEPEAVLDGHAGNVLPANDHAPRALPAAE
jgi:DNA recombination protein RmuC